MQIINPTTEAVIAELIEDSIDTIRAKFAAAKLAQNPWMQLPLSARLNTIQAFSDLLEAEKDTLAHTLSLEMGKPLQEAYNELSGARTRIQFFLDHTDALLKPEIIIAEGATKEKITYEPLGVIANISAWNYPYLVGVNVIIPALLGGNAVLYKPSELTSLTGKHLEHLLHKAGVPEGCFQAVIGGPTAGEALLQLPLDGYFFTGSYHTGKTIAEKVAHKLVPVGLELGGKDPLYVTDDVADLDAVAVSVLEGVMYNNGQSCCAVERVYVHEAVYDAFTKAIAIAANTLKLGNPLDKTTTNGPLSRKAQVSFLQSQIEDAIEKGADILWQYNVALPETGYYFPPVLLTNVHHGMRLMMEESFGPIVGIQRVKDDAEAIALMLDTPYGLTASVYSAKAARAEAILEKMTTGTVYWNCCDRVSATLPWSGRGHSGIGSTLSPAGIRAFVQPKAWHIRG